MVETQPLMLGADVGKVVIGVSEGCTVGIKVGADVRYITHENLILIWKRFVIYFVFKNKYSLSLAIQEFAKTMLRKSFSRTMANANCLIFNMR